MKIYLKELSKMKTASIDLNKNEHLPLEFFVIFVYKRKANIRFNCNSI